MRRGGGVGVRGAQQDVGRLDVAVDDLVPVRDRLGRGVVAEGLVGQGVGQRVPDVPDEVLREDEAVGVAVSLVTCVVGWDENDGWNPIMLASV